MPPKNYRPDVDGLRAVAIVGVLLFHGGFRCSGGYTGVDVFFVISGFLITRLIQQELSVGEFTLAGFWKRRILRIVPAVAVTVIGVLVIGTFLLLPFDLVDLAKSAIAQALLVSNIYFWRDSGYFAGPAELKLLLHTWSLAVEEQFYLFFPLLMFALRKLPLRRWMIVMGELALGSFALSVWASYTHMDANFYLLPTRAWELLVGVLLARLPAGFSLPQKFADLLSWSGLAAILWTYFVYDRETRFPGASALLPCLGTAAIIWSNTRQLTMLGRALSLRPVVYVGLISYSLYLWHWPLLTFIRYSVSEHPEAWLRLLAIAASFVLAAFSLRYIETPFRRMNRTARLRNVFAGAFLTAASVLTFSAIIYQSHGFPQRFPSDFLKFVEDIELPRRFQSYRAAAVSEDRLPVLGVANEAQASFLLWGDSHALSVSGLLDKLATEHGVKGYAACRAATAPLLGAWTGLDPIEARAWNQALLEFVRKKQIKNVIIVGRWESYLVARKIGLLVDDETKTITEEEAKQAFRRGLQRTVDALQREGCAVWIMRQIPLQNQTPREVLSAARRFNRPIPDTGVSLQEHLARQADVNEVLDELKPGPAHVLDPNPFCFNSEGYSLIGGDSRSYYYDDDHLSPYGVERLLRGMFEPILARIKATDRVTAAEQ